MITRRGTHVSGKYRFTLLTHECCGLRWEVLLSSRYPGRERLPVCPRCGAGDWSPPYDHAADVASNPARWGGVLNPVLYLARREVPWKIFLSQAGWLWN